MWKPRPILEPWTPDQARVAAMFPGCRRGVVSAANGVGKTFLAADLVVSFIQDMPAAQVILTAPTNRQVSELLWPHVTNRLLHLGLADVDWIIPTKPRWNGGDKDRLVGFATNTAQRLQGYHAPNLLIICDEASGMPQLLIEALEGIATAEDNYILQIGNPNTTDGAFYQATKQPSYHHETISALTHPNIIAHAEVIPGATTWRSCVDRIRDWCKEVAEPTDETFTVEISDVELQLGPDEERRPRHFMPNDAFRIRYLGRFPNAVAWSLIDRGYINQAMDASIPGERPRIAALDVARTGGDKTIYGLRKGDTVTRIHVIEATDLMTQANEVCALLLEDQPESLTIDAAGLGVGLYDRIIQMQQHVPIRAFQGAEEPISPSDRKRYSNRRTSAYGRLQIAFESRRISIPRDEQLGDELASVRYRYTPAGLMQLLDKTAMSVALGRSPDTADMVSMLWESGTDFNFVSAAPPAAQRQEPEQW